MRVIIAFTLLIISSIMTNAKTLVAYYSYTNNVERIVNELKTQIDCDVIEIEPAEKGLNYAANNYAIGSALISAIRNNPNDAASYPAIDPVSVDLSQYDMVIIAAPLWWSQMAAPLQTFLFNYGRQMGGKNIGVIVSSASSGISGVVADAKRLIPDGKFIDQSLWIRSSQTSNARSMIEQWLQDIDYSNLAAGVEEISIDNLSGRPLEVYNLSGQCVMSGGVDLRQLPAGIFLVSYDDGKKRTTKKMVINRK